MRGKKVKKRIPEGDKIYGNIMAAKFINRMMRDGKKTIAESIFYDAMNLLSQKGENGIEVFERALQNVGPKQEIKARRVGGASYQIPMEVRGDRRSSLAIRWIIAAARKRANSEYHTFAEKLAAELLSAVNNEGEAVRKRDTVQKMADANKAFSHFRF